MTLGGRQLREGKPVQVSEGIHRLTRGVTNFYLIAESGKYTLVDAGTPGDWAFFAAVAGRAGREAR